MSLMVDATRNAEELVHSSISLASALSETGRDDESEPVWQEASTFAAESGDAELLLLVQDQRMVRRAFKTASVADVDRVVQRKSEAVLAGDRWTEVRLAVDFSTLFLRIGEYERTVEHAERARDLFREFGDIHGERVAMRNLGAALLSISGREDEGQARSRG